MQSFKWSFILLAFFALFHSAQANSHSERIKTFKTFGKVYLEKGDEKVRLRAGHIFPQKYTVVTHKRASVRLLFSNGSEVTILPDSSLTIRHFSQEPYDSALGSYDSLLKDPSRSRVILQLQYGSIVGQVKELYTYSEYTIETPIATAIVLNATTYRVDFNSQGDRGIEQMMVTNVDGKIQLEPKNFSDQSYVSNNGEMAMITLVTDSDNPARKLFSVDYRDITSQETEQLYDLMVIPYSPHEDTRKKRGPFTPLR